MNEMIKTIKGDVFANLDPERDTVIAHGCNTEGVMGAGIALYIYISRPNIQRHTRIINDIIRCMG